MSSALLRGRGRGRGRVGVGVGVRVRVRVRVRVKVWVRLRLRRRYTRPRLGSARCRQCAPHGGRTWLRLGLGLGVGLGLELGVGVGVGLELGVGVGVGVRGRRGGRTGRGWRRAWRPPPAALWEGSAWRPWRWAAQRGPRRIAGCRTSYLLGASLLVSGKG